MLNNITRRTTMFISKDEAHRHLQNYYEQRQHTDLSATDFIEFVEDVLCSEYNLLDADTQYAYRIYTGE